MGDQLGTNIVTSSNLLNLGCTKLEFRNLSLQGERKFIAIIFAFILGYGATLAEPALNALELPLRKLRSVLLRKAF